MEVRDASSGEPKSAGSIVPIEHSGPFMPSSMISGRQDWDSDAALERRAMMISGEINRLNSELAWIADHTHSRDDENRNGQSRSSSIDLGQCDDWDTSSDQNEGSSQCVWYAVGAVMVAAAVLIVIVVTTRCCSI